MSKIIKIDDNKGVQKTPLEFSFNEQEFILCDFKTQWTLRQNAIAKPIISEFLGAFFGGISLKDTSDVDMSIIVNSMKVDKTSELLALIFLNKGEKWFKLDTYEQRKEMFLDLPNHIYEDIKEGITDFFSIKLPTLLKDSQTFLQGLEI